MRPWGLAFFGNKLREGRSSFQDLFNKRSAFHNKTLPGDRRGEQYMAVQRWTLNDEEVV
jgi:hypothetical protein